MVRLRKKLEVSIPAGIDDNQQIRLSGQGSEGRNGGPAGDLYITVRVRSHAFFVREGTNVYCDVPITFTEAALGAEIEIPMLDGSTTDYKIPAGTQTDTRFTMRGKGVRQVNGRGTGDLIFRTVVETPKNLTNEQKELLRKLEESFDDKKKGFFNRKKK